MIRWSCLSLLLVACPAFSAGPTIDPAKARVDDKGIHWYDIRTLGLEGQGWTDTKAPFDRFPAKAEKMVRPPVWGLSRHSTGLNVRFVTSARSIQAEWKVLNQNLAMPHMPSTGVSGLDLYIRMPSGKWQWLANGRPSAQKSTQQLASGMDPGEHEYLLYLPLYNGVTSVEIGLPKGAELKKADPYPADRAKPLVIYGTSITQGGCASRPGMVHTSTLGRKLDRPVINLGFSGSGTLDPEVATLMAEIDASVYVLDCIPNLGTAAQVAERTEPFVKLLRKTRPTTPILLVEDRTVTNAAALAGARKHHAERRAANRKAYDNLIAAGDKNLYYLEGEHLLGDDGEGTVDSSHPTDLGFLRQAEAFEAALKPILENKSKK